MKAWASSVLLLLIASPVLAVHAAATAKDEAAIRKATEDFFAAWNESDVKALVSHWTDDATILNPDGRWTHGKAELEQLFTRQRAANSGTVERLVSLQARFLAADLAWVDVDMTVDHVRGPDGAEMPQVKFHLVGLLQKQGGQWRWSEGRPYPLAPPAAPAAAGKAQ
jgi:uncharacterized protein (TIGR02246 family)